MTPLEITITAFILLNLIVTIFLLLKVSSKSRMEEKEPVGEALQTLRADLLARQMDGLTSIRDTIERANRVLDERMSDGNSRLDNRLKMFGEIENKLGQLQQQTVQLENIGANIQSLSELLRPPKLRGGVGEILLENMLAEILPSSMFERQYRLSNGRQVDAVIRFGDMILPIDSKFPMESFERMVAAEGDASARKEFERTMKKHIDDIADRYILPHEDTTEIALMYIPAEAVYGAFVSEREMEGFSYALSRRVIPTSPGHLYGFLVSLSELYRQTALSTTGHKQLAATLTELGEAIELLKGLVARIDGSLRSLSSSTEKARREILRMEKAVVRLRDPDADTEDSAIEEEKTPDIS